MHSDAFYNLGIEFKYDEDENFWYPSNRNYQFVASRCASGATVYILNLSSAGKTFIDYIKADAYVFPNTSSLSPIFNHIYVQLAEGSGDECFYYDVCFRQLSTNYNSATSQFTYILRGELTTEKLNSYDISLTIKFADSDNVTENPWELRITRTK